jgi:hypothetical protein
MELEHPEDALSDDFVDANLTRAEASLYLASVGVKRTAGTLARPPMMDPRAFTAGAIRSSQNAPCTNGPCFSSLCCGAGRGSGWPDKAERSWAYIGKLRLHAVITVTMPAAP